MANKRTDLATVQCRVHRSMSFARHLLHGFLYWKLFLQGIRGRGSTGNGAGEVCFLRGRFLGPQIRYTSEGGWEGGWDSRRGSGISMGTSAGSRRTCSGTGPDVGLHCSWLWRGRQVYWVAMRHRHTRRWAA